MAGFPTPPPLKQKPTLSAIPESVRRQIDHPERITKLLVAFGTVGLFLFLLPCLAVCFLAWSWLQSKGVELWMIVVVLGAVSWFGFSFGMVSGRRIIIEAIRSQHSL